MTRNNLSKNILEKSHNEWITIAFNNQNTNTKQKTANPMKKENLTLSVTLEPSNAQISNNKTIIRHTKNKKTRLLQWKDKMTEIIPAEALLEKGFKTAVLNMLRAKIKDKQRMKGNQKKHSKWTKWELSTKKQKLFKGTKH